MEYFKLNNGTEIPAIGSGTNTFGRDNSDLKSKPTGNYSAMVSTIEAGYRFFDCAISYGNQDGVGKCILESGIPREEFYVLSKIPNRVPYNVDEESIRKSVEQSLLESGLGYYDMFMVHQAVDYNSPDGKMNKEVTVNLYKVLEKLYKEGVFKTLAVANFNAEQLDILMSETEIVPACDQIRSNPANRNQETVDFCKKHGIVPMAHSPMNFTIAGFNVDEVCAEAYKKTASEIGEKYGKSWGQVLLRSNFQKGIISIPKSHTPKYQKENIDIFDFELSDEEMEKLFGTFS